MQNTLRLDCVSIDGFPHVMPFIDGRSLVELITEFELASGYNDPAGGYGPLPAEPYLGDIGEYFRGLNGPIEGDEKSETYLLSCECGVPSCWPLIGHILYAENYVLWERFNQPFRSSRDYTGLGPFRFELAQYEQEVEKIAALLS
jgi:hypothetical protein